MTKFCCILAALLALAAHTPRRAASARQDDPAQKPVHAWTKAEAERFLSDSPWARSQTVRIARERRSQAVAGAPIIAGSTVRAEVGSAEAPIDFTFTLRLRSSRRVREALVRLRQIEAGYDRMSEAKRAEFDAQPRIKGLLDCPACAGNYVLTLSARSAEAPGADPVYATLKGARLEDLQRYVYIADERGARRPLAHFVAPKVPGEEATFFFPRLDERGAPLLTPSSKELVFNLSDMQVNSVANFRVDVSKLVAGGSVDF